MEIKNNRYNATNDEEAKTVACVTSGKRIDELEETVDLMLSADYKERFIAEYRQTKIRYERLKRYNNQIEAAQIQKSRGCQVNWANLIGAAFGTENGVNSTYIKEPPHNCPFEMLRDQQAKMGEYLHILELRAVIEGIDL
jgi:mRNA deadenylase 3'-5' endonuclease subunit Ccr4